MGGHHHIGHAGGRHRWRLLISFVLISFFFLVELVAAFWTGSLALLSDAGHMAADVVALGAALVATQIATRPDPTGRRTYGSYRAEVFASGIAVLLMIGVAVYVVLEAIRRINEPIVLETGAMIVVGSLGLVVNIIALLLLRQGAQESINVKGAYLEVVADTIGSLGVIVGGLLVVFTGNGWWDTVVAVAIGLFVAVRAVLLGREVLAVLGQHAPEHLDLDQMSEDLTAVQHVQEVHDLHVWTLTSGMVVATAHLVTDHDTSPEVLRDARELLRHRYGIAHATLQVESAEDAHCRELGW